MKPRNPAVFPLASPSPLPPPPPPRFGVAAAGVLRGMVDNAVVLAAWCRDNVDRLARRRSAMRVVRPDMQRSWL